MGATLATLAPQAMRESLATPERIKTYCDTLMLDVEDRDSDGHRTAMGVYPAILRATGAGDDFEAALRARFGVDSEAELEAYVRAGRGIGASDPDTADRAAIAWLRSRLLSSPDFRDQACLAVFGFKASEADAAMRAMASKSLTNGNGTTNGNGKSHHASNGDPSSHERHGV